jgi:hypothetical protein
MKTASTEFDENIKSRPKQKEVSIRTGAKGALSFVNEDSDEIEGYGVVNVCNVTEANAAQMERPEPQAKWPKPTEMLEEDVEMEAEKPEEPKSPVLEKKPRAKPVPKRRFIDDLKERSNAEELLEEIMDQRVSIRLKKFIKREGFYEPVVLAEDPGTEEGEEQEENEALPKEEAQELSAKSSFEILVPQLSESQKREYALYSGDEWN